MVNTQAPDPYPKKTIFERKNKNMNSRYATKEKLAQFRSDLQKKKADYKLRTSINKTRDKRQHVFDPITKRKSKYLGHFDKKHSIKLDRLNQTNTSSIKEGRTSKNLDYIPNQRLDKSSNISSGYGDILKLIRRKKARIQSAHPVMKHDQTQSLNKLIG
jgi:hypothetical protein